MNDDEMKKLWNQQEFVPPHGLPDNELVAEMKKKMRQFDQDLMWRDVREVFACVLVFSLASFAMTYYPAPLCRAGSLVTMLSCIFIAWKLLSARRALPDAPKSASTNDFMHAEIENVSRQIQLLKSVLWWYLLPLFVGCELFQIGLSRKDNIGELVLLSVIVAAVFAFVYWANLYAVRKSLLPLKQELGHALDPENVPAPATRYHPGGPRLRIKLGRRTFEFPQECPMLLRFCIALNAFWVLIPCSMLESADIPRQTFPSVAALAVVVFVAFVAWMSADRNIPKSRLSRMKLLVLAFAGFSGLLALAWGINMFRVLLT